MEVSPYALVTLGIVIVLAAVIRKDILAQIGKQGNALFTSFQRSFLAIYFIMMAADWMQGPYVYKLYSYYGYSREENGQLFIAGFGSSLVLGTIVGGMADKYGRRTGCVLYGVLYMLSCATKHFNNFSVLMLGRVLGGTATSLLFSAFEAWMVSEHTTKGFDDSQMSSTFSLMAVGNGLVAIASGFIAQFAVDAVNHPVAPFDLSAAFLAFGTYLILTSWDENYGDKDLSGFQTVTKAASAAIKDRKILLVGFCQAAFEAAMYTFVFMWTPVLESLDADVPHGVVFAGFMVCGSLGGGLFKFFSEKQLPVLLCGAFVVSAMVLGTVTQLTDPTYAFIWFLVFEICVGIYWPAMGTVRAIIVPEEIRASVINLIRLPLNFAVCILLLYIGELSNTQVFALCACSLSLAAGGMLLLGASWSSVMAARGQTSDDKV